MEKFWNLVKGDKPVFVEFFADWCPHCRKMMPIIERLKEKAAGQMEVVQYNIDDNSNQRLVDYYRVQAIPLMMVYKGGEQLWRKNGEIGEDELLQVMKRFL